MSQVLDYWDIIDTFKEYLIIVNTTTADYDLSMSLPTAILNVNITTKNLDLYNPMASEFPGIFMKLTNKESDDLATSGKGTVVSREVSFIFDVDCVYSSYQDTDEFLALMVRNIETNIRGNITLDDYSRTTGNNTTKIISINPGRVDFNTYEEISPFNRSASIPVEVRCWVG